MKVDYSKAAKKWLENSSMVQLDGLALQGIRIDRVEIGLIRCDFVIPNHLSVSLLIDCAVKNIHHHIDPVIYDLVVTGE